MDQIGLNLIQIDQILLSLKSTLKYPFERSWTKYFLVLLLIKDRNMSLIVETLTKSSGLSPVVKLNYHFSNILGYQNSSDFKERFCGCQRTAEQCIMP